MGIGLIILALVIGLVFGFASAALLSSRSGHYCALCDTGIAQYCNSCLNEAAAQNMPRTANGRFADRPRSQG